MELFYGHTDGQTVRLEAEDSGHCIRVLRHRAGDEVFIIDGDGTLLRCRLTDDNPRGAVAEVLERTPGWGSHPYRLTVACCPTKNIDRYEWFVEKAVETGIDRIVPVIADRSERRVFRGERARRIALSATKQSLKARIPVIEEPVALRDYLAALPRTEEDLRLIACCFEEEAHPRISIGDALGRFQGTDVTVLIGPEGDFSPEEAAAAVGCGFRPVHLGPSRLRTETAAIVATMAVYSRFML